MRVPSDRPVYRLTEPFFDPQDNYHPAEKVVVFNGIPNQSMMPLNDLAREKYDAYMDKLDEDLKLVCDLEKRPFTAHHRVYDEPEDDFVDISRDAARKQADPTIKLGNRRKTGDAAEAL